VQECVNGTPFKDVIELDESSFGSHSIRGKKAEDNLMAPDVSSFSY